MSVLLMLLILGGIVTVVTNIWRHGNIDLTGAEANMRGVWWRATIVGVVLAGLLRANLVDIMRNPEGPALYIGWLNVPWGAQASLAERVVYAIEEVIGIVATGLIAAFVSKFWNDAFDALYEFKRWVRGHANALKTDSRPRAAVTRRPRGGRRRGGGGGGGGGGPEGPPRG